MEVSLEALEKHGWNRTENTTGTPLPKRSFTYHEAFRLFRCLEIQIKALEDTNQSFPFLTRDDIRDLGSDWYIIHNMKHLTSLENGKIPIVKPIEKVKEAPEFPEGDLLLPHRAHKSSLYYHVGKMIVELLGVSDDLELLYGSPLYFAIQRALQVDPTKRHLLLI